LTELWLVDSLGIDHVESVMDRETRPKAQDVFNQSEERLIFGEKTTFERACPEVEECVVIVEEEGHNSDGHPRTYRNPGQYINCSNELCYNGGFNIGLPISGMVRNRETQREDSALCQGNEGSPKGRRIYKKCSNFFKYKISIKYRSDQAKAAQTQ